MAYEEVFSRLGIQGPGPARCPSHDDNRESLQVSEGRSGIVMHCHVGCSVQAIMQAIGLPMKALFPVQAHRPQRPKIVAVYSYRDELDRELFQVVRFEPKSFRQRRQVGTKHDGSPVWDWKLGDTRRVLWRLPAVLDAMAADEVIYVTEGEKDAEALLAAGVCATTNPGGAGKWQEDYTTILADAQVVVVSDADDAGKKHAARVAAALRRAGGSVSVVQPIEGFKDVAQHLGAGKTLDQLVPWNESQLNAPTPLRKDTWLLTEFVKKPQSRIKWAVPGVLRTDSRVVIIGGEGQGKSVLLRQIAVAASQGIHPFDFRACEPVRTLIMDLENPEANVIEGSIVVLEQARKLVRGLGRPFIEDSVAIFHRPAGLDLRRKPDREEIEALFEEIRPALVTCGPIYKMFGGLSEGDDDAFRPVLAWLDSVRDRYGFGLLLEGHAPFGQHGNRPMRPFGSSVWLRWPDMGLGLEAPESEEQAGRLFEPHELKVTKWRGARFRHDWPQALRRGMALTPTERNEPRLPWTGYWPNGRNRDN